MRVLFIDSDFTTSFEVLHILKSRAMVVDQARSGGDALDLLRLYDYDVVILDLMLPDMDGFEALRRMRLARINTPVIVLSGTSDPHAIVKGFGLGADDFITKPFNSAELLARLHAVVRRSKGFSHSTLHIGLLQLNLDTRQVRVCDTEIRTTNKEYEILELLVLRKGTILTKEAFLNHLYGGMDEPEMKIIDVFICQLRKKLAAAGCGALIDTIRGRGYMIRENADREMRPAAAVTDRELEVCSAA